MKCYILEYFDIDDYKWRFGCDKWLQMLFPVSLLPTRMCSSCWRPFGTKDCRASGGKICCSRVWKSSASVCSSRFFPFSTSWRRTRESGRHSENLSSNSFVIRLPTSPSSVSSTNYPLLFLQTCRKISQKIFWEFLFSIIFEREKFAK